MCAVCGGGVEHAQNQVSEVNWSVVVCQESGTRLRMSPTAANELLTWKKRTSENEVTNKQCGIAFKCGSDRFCSLQESARIVKKRASRRGQSALFRNACGCGCSKGGLRYFQNGLKTAAFHFVLRKTISRGVSVRDPNRTGSFRARWFDRMS